MCLFLDVPVLLILAIAFYETLYRVPFFLADICSSWRRRCDYCILLHGVACFSIFAS